jgi:hypothetical protein
MENIKLDLEETGCDDADWTELGSNREKFS